jgi:hypothetical protein
VLYWYVSNVTFICLVFLTVCKARWALSADDTLQEVGSSTGICYFSDFEEYLMILETGLRQKKKSIINIIRKWDEKIFPDSDLSIVKGNFKKTNQNNGITKAMCYDFISILYMQLPHGRLLFSLLLLSMLSLTVYLELYTC